MRFGSCDLRKGLIEEVGDDGRAEKNDDEPHHYDICKKEYESHLTTFA